jgi:hypothetical protein
MKWNISHSPVVVANNDGAMTMMTAVIRIAHCPRDIGRRQKWPPLAKTSAKMAWLCGGLFCCRCSKKIGAEISSMGWCWCGGCCRCRCCKTKNKHVATKIRRGCWWYCCARPDNGGSGLLSAEPILPSPRGGWCDDNDDNDDGSSFWCCDDDCWYNCLVTNSSRTHSERALRHHSWACESQPLVWETPVRMGRSMVPPTVLIQDWPSGHSRAFQPVRGQTKDAAFSPFRPVQRQ